MPGRKTKEEFSECEVDGLFAGQRQRAQLSQVASPRNFGRLPRAASG